MDGIQCADTWEWKHDTTEDKIECTEFTHNGPPDSARRISNYRFPFSEKTKSFHDKVRARHSQGHTGPVPVESTQDNFSVRVGGAVAKAFPEICSLATSITADPCFQTSVQYSPNLEGVVHGVLETLRTSHMATFSALLTKIQAELWDSAEEIKQELNARLEQLSEKPDHLTMTKQILDHTVSFDAYFDWNRDRECVNDIILFDVLSY
eukprot:TRINITY_DN3105_c0_g1_i2.p1 TRINITY_DN3105_c0_g1~~TRINITY_DN3105_c0_g1_i2.p1  ORF type:complete len:208 (+),score=30.78 TRINITY_DN3105_c0_g1_i2:160-783(+)